MSEYNVPDYGNITDIKVYGLDESIKRAKYPMSVDTSAIIAPQEMAYWNENGFLSKFIKHMESGEYPKFIVHNDFTEMAILKENGTTGVVLLDSEDVPHVFGLDWSIDKYCKSNKVGLMHRYIMMDELHGNEDLLIDHINRNTLDNRKSNLRLANKSENGFNGKIRKNNTSGVMGVTWKYDKQKWKAYVTPNGKQIHLGYFDDFANAARARLTYEANVLGQFAPQKHLFDEYGITYNEESTKIAQHCSLSDAIKAYSTIRRLAQTHTGEGHDQALTGIIVQFDLRYTVKAWTEAERYTFLDFISSQSTMHRIAKFDLDKQYIEYTDPRMIEIMKELVAKYNKSGDPEDYLRVLYSNPCGFQLIAGMSTNYRQLKTIYQQRKNHRLPEWREFCAWIKTLPMADDLIIRDGESHE